MTRTPTPRLLARVAIAVGVAAVTMAGAVAAFSVAAGADRYPVVKLGVGDKFVFESTRPTTGSGAGVSLIFDPVDCSEPPGSATCDTIPLKLDRDESEGSLNFVLLTLAWDGGVKFPDLVLVVAGLGLGTSSDYNLYVWKVNPDNTYTRIADGGFDLPELLGFTAEQDDYMVTVQNLQGPSLGYEFTAALSNEKFGIPFEVLDPALADRSGDDSVTPVDRSGDEAPATSPGGGGPLIDSAPSGFGGSTDVVSLRPVGSDQDFTGFRGAVDHQLAGDLAGFEQRRDLTAAIKADPPGAALVILWLVLLPLVLLLLALVATRRRRPSDGRPFLDSVPMHR